MPTRQSLVAVDIGATKTLLAVRPLDGDPAQWDRDAIVDRCLTPRDPAALVTWIADATERRLDGTTVAIISMAAPGPLDADGGVLTRTTNLGWTDFPIGPLVQEQLGAPFRLEDDGNAATLGEWTAGAGRGSDPFAYLTLSSGIGGGLIAGGSLVRGAAGGAGEIGHLVIDPTGPRCNCGNNGDIESFAGGDAIAGRARSIWPDGIDGRGSPVDATAVFDAADRGDIEAAGLVEEAASAVGAALAAIAAVIAPERIVVGGAIGLGQPRLVEAAAKIAEARVLRETAQTFDVVPAGLGEHSVIAGAAAIARAGLNA